MKKTTSKAKTTLMEKGLFNLFFSYQRIFDCQRDPLFPEGGYEFIAYDLTYPYVYGKPYTEKNTLFYLKGEEGDNGSIKSLSLWMMEENNPKGICVAANGKAYALDKCGFLYVADDCYGYLLSANKIIDSTRTISWTPKKGEVTKFADLKKYSPKMDVSEEDISFYQMSLENLRM